MLRRKFALALLTFGLAVLMGTAASAEERPAGADGKGTAVKGHTYWGRIVSSDDSRHEFVFEGMVFQERRRDKSATGLAEPTITPERPAAERKPLERNAAERNAAERKPLERRPLERNAAERTAGDRGTGLPVREKMFTFTVEKAAQITLDGKPAMLSDLKSGLWARVHARGHGDRPGTATEKRGVIEGRGTENRKPVADSRGAVGTTPRMMTDRVDAFTTRPASFPSGGTIIEKNRTGRVGNDR